VSPKRDVKYLRRCGFGVPDRPEFYGIWLALVPRMKALVEHVVADSIEGVGQSADGADAG